MSLSESRTKNVVLNLTEEPDPSLDGRMFQLHMLPGNRVQLYPLSLVMDERCPVIVGGERCGEKAGHTGKHCWAGGD